MTVGHWYRVHGLCVESELPLLSRSEAAAGTADIRVTTTNALGAEQGEGVVQISPSEAMFHWSDAGSVKAHVDGSILLSASNEEQRWNVRAAVLAPAVPFILHARRHLVLHAAAARIDGRCAVFAADGGVGKSTLTAALLRAGAEIGGDDTVAFTRDAQWLLPAYPEIKLWPDAARASGMTASLGPVNTAAVKHNYPVGDSFLREPSPVSALYVLQPSHAWSVQRIAPLHAVVELIRHSYFSNHLQSTGAAEWHLDAVTRMAATIPAFHLGVPRELTKLPWVVESLRLHLATLG